MTMTDDQQRVNPLGVPVAAVSPTPGSPASYTAPSCSTSTATPTASATTTPAPTPSGAPPPETPADPYPDHRHQVGNFDGQLWPRSLSAINRIPVGQDDLEDMSQARLAPADLSELASEARECTFVFTVADGWPVGVTMSHLFHQDQFWLTAVEGRAHV